MSNQGTTAKWSWFGPYDMLWDDGAGKHIFLWKLISKLYYYVWVNYFWQTTSEILLFLLLLLSWSLFICRLLIFFALRCFLILHLTQNNCPTGCLASCLASVFVGLVRNVCLPLIFQVLPLLLLPSLITIPLHSHFCLIRRSLPMADLLLFFQQCWKSALRLYLVSCTWKGGYPVKTLVPL